MNPLLLIQKANALELALIETGGEITAQIEVDMLVVQASVDAVSTVSDRLDLYAKFWLDKAKEAEKIGRSLTALRQRLKERLKQSMIDTDTKELKGEETRFVLVEGAHLHDGWQLKEYANRKPFRLPAVFE